MAEERTGIKIDLLICCGDFQVSVLRGREGGGREGGGGGGRGEGGEMGEGGERGEG